MWGMAPHAEPRRGRIARMAAATTMITVAPTGAESSKADVPALPVTLDELVVQREGLRGGRRRHDPHPYPRRRRAAHPRPAAPQGHRGGRARADQPAGPAVDGRFGARRLPAPAAGAGRRARLVLADLRHRQLRRRRLHEPMAVHGGALPGDPAPRGGPGVRAVRPRSRSLPQPAARLVWRSLRGAGALRPGHERPRRDARHHGGARGGSAGTSCRAPPGRLLASGAPR